MANVIGEFEFHHRKVEGKSETKKVLNVVGGLSREFGPRVAIGAEARYERGFVDEGDAPSAIFAGPTVNFQMPKVQLALGWQPQIQGTPKSTGSLNLGDFARSEFRMILGVTW